MRTFDYHNLPKNLFAHTAGDLNVLVYEDRGKLDQLKKHNPDLVESLRTKALVDSVESSAHIEGLYPPTEALHEAIDANAYETDDMAKYVGYARALRVINEHACDLPLASGTVVDLYEQLYCNRVFKSKSRYRKSDYMQMMVNGHPEKVLVSPVPAFECPLVLGAACDSLADAFEANTASAVILSAVFTVDMLCIRPFETGNGRVSRLFSDLLLQKAGFDIAQYLSLDTIIEERAAEYYDALNSCVEGWDRGRNNYEPYVVFWLNVVHDAYARLFGRLELIENAGDKKTDRVRLFVARAVGSVTKREILEAYDDISVSTVENALGAMVKAHEVEKRGAGRATSYVWVGEEL